MSRLQIQKRKKYVVDFAYHHLAEGNLRVRRCRAKAITVAIEEMRCTSQGNVYVRARLYATLWLGSRALGPWIADLGVTQREILLAIDWRRHAIACLLMKTRTNERQRLLLRQGINALAPRRKLTKESPCAPEA